MLAERSFRSDLAVSVPWATYEAGRARRLAARGADALRIAASDRPYWDRVVAERSGWPLAVVRAVADRNGILAGGAASLDLTTEDQQGLARALAFAHPGDLTLATLLDPALLDGRVTMRRYTPTAQFASAPRAGPAPQGAPPPRGPLLGAPSAPRPR